MHTGTHDLTCTRQHDLANMVVLIGQRKSTKALRKMKIRLNSSFSMHASSSASSIRELTHRIRESIGDETDYNGAAHRLIDVSASYAVESPQF
jgi:hypothetical protein